MLLLTFAIFSNFVNECKPIISEAPVSIRMLLPRKPIVPCRKSFLRAARNPGGPVRRLNSHDYSPDSHEYNLNS